ncbi:MAG: [NiFe] hydrogenase nickel incorporation-associated protein HypB [Myxococcaceae bacterium]|nr:[NiFe] hydrogenase nickel incorporation-associated protein HypB [Myxococcaceae bacterium]
MCATCGCGSEHHDDHHHGDGPGNVHGHTHAHGELHDHDHAHGHAHGHDHEHAHAGAADEISRTIRFERDLLAKNARLAAKNRSALAAARIAIFNLIGSPGAGKTALLEATVRRLGTSMPLAVLEGDQATDNDAKRIERAGCRAIQINTGTGCHLDASMIESGIRAIGAKRESVVFVENVGNLVCPALFDLGELAKIVVMSVTEGEDKPVKYPHIFRAAELFVLTKVDLQPLVKLDEARCITFARRINPRIKVLRVSATTGEGVEAFCTWIRDEAPRAWRTDETQVVPS